MRYAEAAAVAPPGSDGFGPADLARVPPGRLRRLLAPGPAAPPLEDVAAALGDRPHDLFAVASALPPERGERLLRLAQRPVPDLERHAAGRRLVRGLFWPLVYELAPERWEQLADAEPVHPGIMAALPADGARVVELAAGCGRLTAHLASRAAELVALEPVSALAARLQRRVPGARVVAALNQAPPLRDGWADLAVCCAALSPDPPAGGEAALAALERLARPGGTVAVVGPEAPGWFVERGYRLADLGSFDFDQPAEVVAFFGPMHPPSTLLTRTR